MSASNLMKNPVHLGLQASAEILPEFTGAMEWYADYAQSHEADGAEGRLVTMHSFSESWGVWEMHPVGSEVVICISGAITLIQEFPDGRRKKVALAVGEYAINEAGVWHTADVDAEATALFITAGKGTEHKSRSS
ncbi:MAG: hypothetical protein ACPGSM_05455 [Thiolinea sp.]